jgi:hypothetical protein
MNQTANHEAEWKKQARKGCERVLDPFQIFLTAEAFRAAAVVLENKLSQEQLAVYSWPAVTNSAFALELYLKTLLTIEHGRCGRGHDLTKLFRSLTPQSRDSLTKKHNALAKTDTLLAAVNKHTGMKVDLQSLLVQGRMAFEQYRYAYEGVPTSTGWGLHVFLVCIRDHILRHRPEWKKEPAFGFLNPKFLSKE